MQRLMHQCQYISKITQTHINQYACYRHIQSHYSNAIIHSHCMGIANLSREQMSATEIIPFNFSALDVAPLLAYFGIPLRSIVKVGNEDRIVVDNQFIVRARRILDAYNVNYDMDNVNIVNYRPGVPGELRRLLSFNPSEMYPAEGNAYVMKRNGGGGGILYAQGNQGIAFAASSDQVGPFNINSLSAGQVAALRQ